jgi:hypothetical protein
MRLANLFATKRVVLTCLSAGALAAAACANGPQSPTSPSATVAVRGASGTGTSSVSASSPRSGDLHVTKECSAYTGLAGSFCTITSSNVKAIEVGSRVVYAQAAGATSLDSDVVLDTPGPGNNTAFGHCALDFATGLGLCTFSGGTGKFSWFDARMSRTWAGPTGPGTGRTASFRAIERRILLQGLGQCESRRATRRGSVTGRFSARTR